VYLQLQELSALSARQRMQQHGLALSFIHQNARATTTTAWRGGVQKPIGPSRPLIPLTSVQLFRPKFANGLARE
jgi:hypothetical protein